MTKQRLIKSAILLFSYVLFTLPATVFAAGSTGGSNSATVQNISGMSKTARSLGGVYNSKTNTITLKTNKKLSSDIKVRTDKPLTINMNGHKITGGNIVITNSAKAPVLLLGNGKLTDCQIRKWGNGKLTLNGNITYKHSTKDVLSLREGTTVIRNGNFYAGEKYVLWSDYGEESNPTYLYIKGGNFHGDLILSNCATYINKGTIGGKINLCGGALYVQGGTIQKGICDSGSDDLSSEIIVSGGKILDKIVLDNGYYGALTVSGGVIKSDKDAVIQSNIHEGNTTSHGDIQIQGGTIISAKENGFGIKATNTEIKLSGGTIENTTGKGNTAVYSVRYNNNVKEVPTPNDGTVTFNGFQSNINNLYKENYCGENVQYRLDDDGTLTISGIGDMFTSIDFSSIDNAQLENKIKNVIVEEGVTSVGGFSFCSNLKSVSLPTGLKTIYHTAFYECTSLERITMQSGLKEIGSTAFMYDKNLKEINMPDTVTKIGEQAFDSCYQLKKVHLSNNLNALSDSMFNHCSSLNRIEIPDSITEIPYGTFCGCTGLASVKLPAKLKKIGATAFSNCVSLTGIEIPSTVKEIGRSAFKNCKKLKTVQMKGSKKMVIHKTAFKNTPYDQNKSSK